MGFYNLTSPDPSAAAYIITSDISPHLFYNSVDLIGLEFGTLELFTFGRCGHDGGKVINQE